ncbi:MAG: Beta-ketoadipate enol-lactone hydrolase [uncultured Microvirga sp.]|uniref:Beta-ketoadipate enol-lactone hydrolase n=1 Tax=uncultured Microvirga sp. TaxID=412392 RepID=A0A6J4KQD8_9HYPH|nr:MAG: Beta-ketoadipate enol-lactone hydrolase [uncultured Microvirga sp.]
MKILAALVAGLVLLLVAGALATWVIARRIEARYPPLGRFVELDGGRLHLVEAGPADGGRATVVLLHGASGNSADPMAALGARLAASFRVIAVDRPGHGWSDRIGSDAASPARQAALIREALQRIGIERAIVVGHSWAGALALNLALDHPGLVTGLVLLAPVSHPWPGAAIAWYYTPTAARAVGWLFTRTVAAPLGMMMLNPAASAVFAPQPAPADYVEAARIPLLLRPNVFQANAEDVAGLHAFVVGQSARYGGVRVPTVIISGDADTIVWTNLHSRSLEREIPGAKLIVLPGVGHMPHHAAADLVLREIEALAERIAPKIPSP